MNIIDAIIILMILMYGVIGSQRGVFKQLVTTVGFIIVVLIAFYLKNPIAEFLSLNLPFFKFGGNFANVTSLNIILYQLISFVLVIILLEAILNFLIKVTGIVEKILKFTIILALPSKILGFIAGLIEGFVIVFLVLFVLRQPAFNIDLFETSKLTNPILKSTPLLSNIAGGFVDTFNDLYVLSDEYANDEISDNELNLRSIDIMLKHKIITYRYVVKLVDANKININGIDNVINKYR